ncbi:MAG: phosphoribosylamine---glycine ligase [Actinoplanes sp.]|jgi:phosphoribosylamine--glycine ligase|nr:phosphoribosylamine---glycine ligase [Actinoplanes sp.]
MPTRWPPQPWSSAPTSSWSEPEAALVAGVTDAVQSAGIACFGPTRCAAELEGSKTFAEEVMAAAGVPTARSLSCTTEAAVAAALDEFGAPYVVKNDSLAAGKGVVVTEDRDAALAYAAECDRVVVEEFLNGPEISLFVVTDGVTAAPLLLAQDYKRAVTGDTGPNTGGMGAYAPISWVPDDVVPEGYPESPSAGDLITGADGPGYLHAGTRLDGGGRLVTCGGRAICCTATGDTLDGALAAAYELAGRVTLDGAVWRADIGLPSPLTRPR